MFAWKQGVYEPQKIFIVPTGQPIWTCKPPCYIYTLLSKCTAGLHTAFPLCTYWKSPAHPEASPQPSWADLICSLFRCDHSHVQTQLKERMELCPLTTQAVFHMACQVLSLANAAPCCCHSLSSAPCWIQRAVLLWCPKHLHYQKEEEGSQLLPFIFSHRHVFLVNHHQISSNWDSKCNICPEKELFHPSLHVA